MYLSSIKYVENDIEKRLTFSLLHCSQNFVGMHSPYEKKCGQLYSASSVQKHFVYISITNVFQL
jgi:hypothetical protein